jgi:alpha-galactosidase
VYSVLAALRERYPTLLIENCSGGGRRLDFGMLRYTDVGWMDDITAPSAHVRHNLQGLGTVFPPAYLLSFVIDHADEPIHGAADMPLYFRSRMGGILGITLRGEEFGEEDIKHMMHEVSLAKEIRAWAPDAAMMMLTSQVDAAGSDGWDAIQLVSPSTGASVLLAFAGPGAADSTVVKLKAFDPGTRYVVSTVGGRHIAEAPGTDLLDEGIRIAKRRGSSASLVLVVTKLNPAEIQSPR